MNKLKTVLTIIYIFISFANSNLNATTLEEALISTYNNNPILLGERESLKSDDEAIIEALAGFLPQITSNFNRAKNYESAKAKDYDNNFLLYDRKGFNSSGSISLKQSLFNGGADLLQYKITKKLIQASRAKLSKIEQQVFLSTISTYINILLTEEKLNIHKNSINVLEKYLETINAKFKLEEATIIDVAQAKSRLANSISEYTKVRGDLIKAKTNYESITGIKAENLSDISESSLTSFNLDEIIDKALKNNPSMIIAKINSDVEASRILQKASRFSPRLDLNAHIHKTSGPDYQYSESYNRSILRKNKNKQIMLNLEIPIYQKGLEYQGVRKQKTIYRQSKNDIQIETNKIINEVTKIKEDIEISDSLINSSSEGANAATIALEAVTQEANLTQRTTLDVLETEQEFKKAKLNEIDAKYNKIMNTYNLKAQLGELTAYGLSLPTQIYDPKSHYNKIKFKVIGF